jgi:hypothetical protein
MDHMKSTHGSLDRNNSLTFLLTMTDKQLHPRSAPKTS